MHARDLYDFRSLLKQKGIMFCYSGYITETVLSGVGEALKQKMTMDEANTKTIRSVFAVFVEQMQNMIRYSAEKEPENEGGVPEPPRELRYGVIAIGHGSHGFQVEAGNLVLREDVERMRAWLGRIANASREELKALYKEQLRTPQPPASKGAGIGFIEIARRASQPLQFDFMEVDERFSFFSLRAEI